MPGNLSHVNSELVWWSDASQTGWAIPYPAIMCHATCKDTTDASFPHACIYCHLDTEDEDAMMMQGQDDEESEVGGGHPTIVPL